MVETARGGFKLHAPDRVAVTVETARAVAIGLFAARGCRPDEAAEIADHLIEADRMGVESHGLVRVLQYAREFETGMLTPAAPIECRRDGSGRAHLEAHGGIGIPAMRTAVACAAQEARAKGLGLATLTGAGHTGRLGAFAETAARAGCMTIAMGGGDRKRWRMVAPHGGRQALLPTNPYCIGIPGGDRGPVILDCATSMLAGGWIYAARAAGTTLPAGAVIDRHGAPTEDPEAYFAGGAILPKGGVMGYGLALVAELVGEAMLGPVQRGEINWMILAVDCRRFRAPAAMQAAAEEILAEIRQCPPMPGIGQVEVPGERERDRAAATDPDMVHVPRPIWDRIASLAASDERQR
jgi:LDH2 family malate/lactate/ureidoglycolate dehydrogenase